MILKSASWFLGSQVVVLEDVGLTMLQKSLTQIPRCSPPKWNPASHSDPQDPLSPVYPPETPSASKRCTCSFSRDHPQDSGVLFLLHQTRAKAAERHLGMETKGCETSRYASQNKTFFGSCLRLPSPPRHHGALGSSAFPPLMLKKAVVHRGAEEQKGPSLCVRELPE